MNEPRICEHPSCTCPLEGDSPYCSAECAKGALGEIPYATPCACGHPECR